ncbi:U6 snRNA phosphodiesterase-like isoform X1 [Octopus sinensis]|uniref:U6 snRNA phosphodiesterase n=1 Tax=Octopus sinensis TaxID=2607531 RepID=A0A6P7TBE2_9MOLL|nr:U6 snRNA phosphodiesterase-like isoform X1 [Octopus sinensis]
MASGRIVDYSGSSDSDLGDEEDSKESCLKRKSPCSATPEKEINNKRRHRDPLPLPDDIKNMFKEKEISIVDNPDFHEGRIRSFPHLAGNWATHVYIEVERNEHFAEIQRLLLSELEPFADFKAFSQLHLSLSKTVPIRHHWIQPLTDSLSVSLQDAVSTSCGFCAIKLYTNDENTRTFLSLQVTSSTDTLFDYTTYVDKAFKDFNLPPFYSDPSFHVSIAWSLGDVINAIPEETMQNLQNHLDDYLSEHINSFVISITEIHCQIGNKHFKFPLKSRNRY